MIVPILIAESDSSYLKYEDNTNDGIMFYMKYSDYEHMVR
jgi:hypothetical protein